MVFEDTGELLHGQIWQGRANGLEGGVVGGEDGEVFGRVHGVDQVCLHQSAGGVGEAGINGRRGDVGREGEDLVDDVDNTSGKVHVLILLASGLEQTRKYIQPW